MTLKLALLSLSFHVRILHLIFLGWHLSIRFNYTYYDKKHGAIHKSIEALDRMGMDIIETGNPEAFKQYLLEFDNTICGRHPISVFVHVSVSDLICMWNLGIVLRGFQSPRKLCLDVIWWEMASGLLEMVITFVFFCHFCRC